MKRIFSLFAAILLAAIAIVPAAAKAEGGKVIFSMNSPDHDVSPGESFTITLSISGDYKAHGMNLSIEFDPNSMTLEKCTPGDYLSELAKNSGGTFILDHEKLAPAGKIKLGVIMPTDPASGSGDMMKMEFHVNDGVTVNQQVIMVIHEFISMPVGEMFGDNISFETNNSIIKIKGGTEPASGYNEGDTGIGNNISSSPSLAPDSTPSSGSNAAPTTRSPRDINSLSTVPPVSGENDNPGVIITASPDGSVTASPVENANLADIDSATDNSGKSGSKQKSSSLLYIIVGGLAALGIVGGLIAFFAKRNSGWTKL